MTKKELIIITDKANKNFFSVTELCEICHIPLDVVEELARYDIIQLEENQIINMAQLSRIKKALRLQRDLEINLAGVAILLELLDELADLRVRAAFLEKHFMK